MPVTWDDPAGSWLWKLMIMSEPAGTVIVERLKAIFAALRSIVTAGLPLDEPAAETPVAGAW
jgi:hypothetical protein